jgi:GT2 family glycosyltransferase
VAFDLGVWRATGGFDEQFERGGDDVDFSWRVQLAGFRVACRPDAILHYRGRTSKKSLFHQYIRDGQGAAHLYALHRRNGMPRRSMLTATKSILALAVRLPALPFLEIRDQGHLIRAAGKQAGRVLGSLRHRVVYL